MYVHIHQKPEISTLRMYPTANDWLTALTMKRKEIVDGLKYSFWDDDTIGNKETYCSHGCSSDDMHNYGLCIYTGIFKCPLGGCGNSCMVFKNDMTVVVQIPQEIILERFDAAIKEVQELITQKAKAFEKDQRCANCPHACWSGYNGHGECGKNYVKYHGKEIRSTSKKQPKWCPLLVAP